MGTQPLKDQAVAWLKMMVKEIKTNPDAWSAATYLDENSDNHLVYDHIQRAKKQLAEVEYELWHEKHTSGVPYQVKATEAWK